MKSQKWWVWTSLLRSLDDKEKTELSQWLVGNNESREHFLGWERLSVVFRLRTRLQQYNTEKPED